MTSLPIHIAVSERLAREIQAGLRADGSRLPPERALAAELGIAVGTLRKALADLAEKGLLERVHGSGNYVRNASGAQTLYSFFRLERPEGGGLPTARVLDVERKPKPAQMPGIGDARDGVRIRRRRMLDGRDAALEEIWLDAEMAGEAVSGAMPESLYQFYREALGLVVSRVTDRVSVAPPPHWRPRDFTSRHDVWGLVERTAFDQGDRAIEWSRTWFDPAKTSYVSRSA